MLRGGGAALSRSSILDITLKCAPDSPCLRTHTMLPSPSPPRSSKPSSFSARARGLGRRQSRHGRAESALNNDVSKIRPQLDRDHRSAYVPKHVNIDVGPLPPPVPCKKSHKRRRFGMSTPTTSKKKRRSARKQPLMALPSEAVEEVFSHASRIEDLHLQGNTVDVIRTLTSLGGSMPLLSCLSIGTLDEFKYPHFDSGDEDEREDPSLVLSETLFGGTSILRTWPDASTRGIESVAHATILVPASLRRAYYAGDSEAPVLLIIEDTFLELLIALLSCISVPPTVRRHIKLKLDGSKSDAFLWSKFSSMMPEIIANSPDPIHGIHFRREPSNTSVWLWVSPTGHSDIPLSSSSSWPPLDDPFSLEIHCADRNCLYGLHTSYSVSFFHRLRTLRIARRATLRFGDGAAELLVSALYGGSTVSGAVISTSCAAAITTTTTTTAATTPADSGNVTTGAAAWRGFLSGSLQRVIISRSAFSTRILWDWIHYAYARPAEWDSSLLRMNVLTDLSVPRWKPADIEPVEDVTESLLIFLLHCRSTGAQVSDLSLAESTWNEPGGLEILRRLLHILDPDWNVILETISPPD
ncbi:hypothetical protein BGY98DRAFT_1167945 [Russula aff. rugulosa BPL654]|nr:hypothetical protein BGY98DRAFT_1167945 [Russula aff. rugulosa BPL654]